jgi:hypothetical protein
LQVFHIPISPPLENKENSTTVCWHVIKRGAVGETPLHLYLLVGSTLHKELAKRLIKLFPALVNDIYLSDEYYGKFLKILFLLYIYFLKIKEKMLYIWQL